MAVKIQQVLQRYVREECQDWMMEEESRVMFVTSSTMMIHTSRKSQEEITYIYKSKGREGGASWHQVVKVV